MFIYVTKDLLCKVKARANSMGPQCNSDAYLDKHACPELTVGETWGDGGEVEFGCGVISLCVEVSPLFGCESDAYCSTLAPVLK